MKEKTSEKASNPEILVTSEVGYVTGLRCLRCGQLYPPTDDRYVCHCRDNVGSDMGTLNAEYDYSAIRDNWSPVQLAASAIQSIARYGPLLPVRNISSLPPVPVGMTPLIRSSRLGGQVGLPRLYIKDEGRNPSASLKDRASAVALARAKESAATVVATASTGNAAAALATLAAGVGMETVIFVPKSAPEAKIAQLLVFGSTVLAVDGSYDMAFDLCVEACQCFGWYNRNTGYNPWMTEGKKTVAYEIAEQLTAQELDGGKPNSGHAQLMVPDAVFVAVGDGCIIGGMHKGFLDLQALGWIDRMPRLFGVQSEKSAALATAWEQGLTVPVSTPATTRADSINVDAPRDAIKALNAVRNSQGAFVVVSDSEILDAVVTVARHGGVFSEPAGAAAYAGLVNGVRQGHVSGDDCVVVISTGNGLKDISAALQMTGRPVLIEPTLGAVQSAMKA